ncbi:MAG TPA: DUF1800 domain-containing protein [Tepidisphaeraceae bacterium]|nr:DUF1800 domain-containing protein [Tepidisphaeraceae bacterium]
MIDLHPLLQPYVPNKTDSYDWTKAAHLLNRAGFGGTEEEIQKAMKLGPQGAVDWLMDFPDAPAEEQSQTDVPDLSSIAEYPSSFKELRQMFAGKSEEERKELRQKFQRANAEAVRASVQWWLTRMAYGPNPMQEKLTLFWHGHFTTSARDERSATAMWQQNELLRRMSAGNYKEFVHLISKDPAMLDYLNNEQNRKQHPNENYAREVMELFTLGIGNYTEQDVREGARAFTGWAHDGDEFIFRKYFHDDGIKTFLGQTGNFDGDDVINIIFEQPACPRFISKELFEWFVRPAPDPSLVNSMAEVLKENNWELRPLLRTMLTSKIFYHPDTIGVQIKCPIQLVVGTTRQLNVEIPRLRGIAGALQQMGQVPFYPPNVRGWPGGNSWISTSSLFVRYNTDVYLAGGSTLPAFFRQRGGGRTLMHAGGGGETVDFDPSSPSEPSNEVVDHWVARLIARPIADDKRQVLLNALNEAGDDSQGIKKVVQLIVSMPEYQLC